MMRRQGMTFYRYYVLRSYQYFVTLTLRGANNFEQKFGTLLASTN
jgi:hypothetical protein